MSDFRTLRVQIRKSFFCLSPTVMYVPRSPSYRPNSPAPVPSTVLPVLGPRPRPPYGIPVIHLYSDDEYSGSETLGSEDTVESIFVPLKKRRVAEEDEEDDETASTLSAPSETEIQQVFPCCICLDFCDIGQFQNCRFCHKTVCHTCILHTRYVSGLEGLCALCKQTFGDGLPDEEDTDSTESEYNPSVASSDLED